MLIKCRCQTRLITLVSQLTHDMDPPVRCHGVGLLQGRIKVLPASSFVNMITLFILVCDLKCVSAASSVMLSLSCSISRMYSRSASDCSSGMPEERVIASRLTSRHPLLRSTRNA